MTNGFYNEDLKPGRAEGRRIRGKAKGCKFYCRWEIQPGFCLPSFRRKSSVNPVVLNWGRFVAPQGTLGNVWKHIWLSQWCVCVCVLVASSEQRPEMLLNIPQCTEQHPLTLGAQNCLVPMPRLRNPELTQQQF